MPLATASIENDEYAYYVDQQCRCTPHDALHATTRDLRLTTSSAPNPASHITTHNPAAPLRALGGVVVTEAPHRQLAGQGGSMAAVETPFS